MCQTVSAGGRRCPIHQHQNIAAIRAASHASGLTRYQTERLFAEIRREGRNAAPITEAQRVAALASVRASVADSEIASSVNEDLTRSADNDRELDGSSAYAMRLIGARAKERGDNLKARFAEVATRTGLTVTEVADKYKGFMAAVPTSHGSETPDEYDQNTRRRAVLSNLPYDRASVAALEKLNTLVSVQSERRVTMVSAPESSHIHSYGYDEGRLEVAFRNNPEVKYAYQNVPEQVWESLASANNPGSLYARTIRGNEDYMYESTEEAEADAHRLRCASCGQFRASSHTCAERIVRNEMENAGLSATEIAESATSDAPEAVVETEPVEPLPVVETLSTEATTNETDADIAAADEVIVEAPEADTFVLAAPSLSTLPIYEAGARTSASVPEHDNDFINYQSGLVEPLPDHVPTVENQITPVKFDTETLLVEKVGGFKRAYIVNNDHMYRLDNIRSKISDADYVKMENAPEDVYHIVAHNQDGTASIIKSYSNNEMTASTSHAYDDAGQYTHGYSLKRLGKIGDETKYTRTEHQTLLTEENAKFAGLVASEEAVTVYQNLTGTRKYMFDANAYKQPIVTAGKLSDVRKAFKDNKVVIMPVLIRTESHGSSIDDQGFVDAGGYANISGEVAFRRNAEGVVEVVSSGRKLQCDCYQYRVNYNCKHIGYTQRHIGNVVQQMIPVSQRVGTPEGTHRLMSTTLRNRADATVVPEVVAEDGTVTREAYVSFGAAIGYDSKSEWGTDARRRIVTPENLRNIDATNPSVTDLQNLTIASRLSSQIDSIQVPKSPGVIRTALKRSDVEMPMEMNFRVPGARYGYGSTYAKVSGTMLFAKTVVGSEEIETKSHTLKCNCAVYAENYDCEHVRFTAGQGYAIVTVGSRLELEENKLTDVVARHSDQMRIEQEIQGVMDRENMTRLRATRHIARVEAERIEAERLRTERRAAEQAAREAVYARQRREEAEAMIAVNAESIAHTQLANEARAARWAAREEGYTESPKKFYEDVEAALERKKNGEEPIIYRTENVTDGICADVPGGRKFGVELEFDIKSGVNRSQALANIGRELHAAGLTNTARQEHYHAGQNSGWEKWSFEQDCTVDAELVSPLMSDTPEHWAQLQQVCEIINRNGGHATTRTGSHVHISSGSFGLSSAKPAAVLRLVNNNEDFMTRISSNPATGKHRGGQWCAPNVSDTLGDIPEDRADGHQILGRATQGHGVALNFEAASNTNFKKSHLEFRSYDGTANAAIIQQQVAFSAAIVDAAEREVIQHGAAKKPTTDRIKTGHGRKKEADALVAANVLKHTEETFIETNKEAASFIDTLFRRKEDRAAAASLFAITKWQN
jgi:hypothetical protein